MLQAPTEKTQTIAGTDVLIVQIPDALTIGGKRLDNPEAIADYFRNNPHPYIDYVEPNYLYSIDSTPNDPLYGNLWGMDKIQAPQAWDIDHDCSDVIVGVIDTGIDWTHPDLIDNIWQNLGEDADGDGHVLEYIGGTWQFDPGDINNVDNDGNGYKDDFVGWDFVNNDNNPMDDNSHGTHCAGTIGARGNNGIGVAGVCWNVKLMALKFLNAGGGGSSSGAIAALNYATAKGAKITNNSWGGGGYNTSLYNAIQNAQNNDALFVAAAGNFALNNDIIPFYPASYNNANIIAVASSNSSDVLSSFSHYGATSVDLAAPGSGVYSTTPNNTYGNKSGTSMATPHVAGAAALVRCAGMTYADVKAALLNNTTPLASLTGKCVTGGRLNLYNALSNTNCCNVTATFTLPTAPFCTNQSITFTNTSANATTYEWKVDNVTQSSSANFTYTFTTDGAHSVALVASNGTCSDAVTQTVNINGTANAAFTHTETNLTTILTAMPGSTSYSWDFGDGGTSNTQNATHTYAAAGTYNVCLTVVNGCGSVSGCESVTVNSTGGTCYHYSKIHGNTSLATGANTFWYDNTENTFYMDGMIKINAQTGDLEISNSSTMGLSTPIKTGTNEIVGIHEPSADNTLAISKIQGNLSTYLWNKEITMTNTTRYLAHWTTPLAGDNIAISSWRKQSNGNTIDDLGVMRIDNLGNIVWAKYYDYGGGDDQFGKIINDGSDNLVTVGILGGGGGNIVVAKIGADGNHLNTYSYNRNNSYSMETPSNIIKTIDGGYAILVKYTNNLQFPDPHKLAVIKIDANFALQWVKNIDYNNQAFTMTMRYGMVQTVDGSYFISTTTTVGSANVPLIVKLDSNGNYVWAKQLNNNTGALDLREPALLHVIDNDVVVLMTTRNGSSVYGTNDLIVDRTDSNFTTLCATDVTAAVNSENWTTSTITPTSGATTYTVANLTGTITANPLLSQDFCGTTCPPPTCPVTTQFAASTTTCKNTPTTFTNTSTGATTYQWLVDNTPVSTATNLTHTFTTAGTHTVKLIASNGTCSNELTQTITVDGNCVYPGDANADGTVNMLDWLALGLAFDATGTPRTDQTIDYTAKQAADFATSFTGNLFVGINHKHTDTNGNGTVEITDSTAITQNYGLVHALGATSITPSNSPEVLLSTESNTPVVAQSTPAYIDITLQNALNGGAISTYGMAFSVSYAGASNPQLNFAGSCLGAVGTDFIATTKNDAVAKKLYVGITRTNHANINTYGKVATMQVTIDELPAGNPLTLTMPIDETVVNDNNGYIIPSGAGSAAMMEAYEYLSQTPATLLKAKALLQGAMTEISLDDAVMTTSFNPTIPTQQPYNVAPWNYAGTETGTIPPNAVDWVLIELHSSLNPTQIALQKAVLLLNDGSLQDVGTPIQANAVALTGLTTNQSYTLTIRHRNHLSVKSSNAIAITSNVLACDFTQSANQTQGGAAQLAFVNNRYALKQLVTPIITGTTTLCNNATATYTHSNPVSGNNYTWAVTGGTIVSGQNSNNLVVQWTTGTSGTISRQDQSTLNTTVLNVTLNPAPDAIVSVGGNASGGGTPGLTTYNLCPTCKVYLKSNYTNLTTYTLKWYKNNNELTQYQNYLGGNVKKAGNYKLKVIRNSTGCEDFSQTVVITGGAPMAAYNSNPNIDNSTESAKNEEDLFETDDQMLQFQLYPNPTKGTTQLYYQLALQQTATLQITDLMGKQLQQITLSNSGTHTIDLNNYPNGIYLCQMMIDSKLISTQKLVVMH